MTNDLHVTQATQHDAAAWDDFIAARGTFFHRFGWASAIEKTYRHEAVYLKAERAGNIVGVLPLVDRRSLLFGRALISVGFTVGGGIVAEDDEAAMALAAAAEAEGRARRSSYVELRSPDQTIDGWAEKRDVYDNFSWDIEQDEEARLRRIPRKKRADIRKAIAAAENGHISARVTTDTALFWRHFAQAQRNHGTPVFPKSWLDHQFTVFGDSMEIALVEAEGRPLAGVVNYYTADTVHLYSAFISEDARTHHAGDYLYWWMMGHALHRGATNFDLGRSKRGTGSHAYKTYWGMTPQPMVYLYRLIGTEEMPNINPKNPKFETMTRVWQRLPMPVANRMGPLLAGHLA